MTKYYVSAISDLTFACRNHTSNLNLIRGVIIDLPEDYDFIEDYHHLKDGDHDVGSLRVLKEAFYNKVKEDTTRYQSDQFLPRNITIIAISKIND